MDSAQKKIAMVLEYHGSPFVGWQYQPGQRTVQGVLHDALITVLGKGCVWGVESSGRTDSGVHARGQVVTFNTSREDLDCKKLALSISSLLRGEVGVLRAGVVDASFHPRKGVLFKEYRYYILNRAIPPTLDAGFVWHVRRPLDVDFLRQESSSLLGQHNFSAFRGAECNNFSVFKELFSININKVGDVVEIAITGSGFLKQMVRIIVGTLVDRARNKLHLNLHEILELETRSNSGVTAPAHGLFLHSVKYSDAALGWLSV